MSPRLRDHPDDLAALVAAVSSASGIVEAYVEKDFWATEVLRAAAAARTVPLVAGGVAAVAFLFKGGTSLSRVFHITERFSEDIDLLAVFPEGASLKARHNVLKQVDADVTAHLHRPGEVVPGSSDTGVKRYTAYRYPTDRSDVLLREGVLLELGSRGGTHPAGRHPYTSMVAEHAIGTFGDSVGTWEEFAPFEVLTLAPERTLLEKLAGLHAMATLGQTGRLLKAGRHFYDVYRLLGDTTTYAALVELGSDGVAALVADIDEHSRAAGFPLAPRPAGGYAVGAAFDDSGEMADVVSAAYRGATQLIYGAVPTIGEIRERVRSSAALL